MHESGEMYLETILILSRTMPNVRSIDIAEHMGYSKPSISRAMGKLKQDDCILIDENGFITFTEKGRGIAEKIYERHQVLSRLFTGLGVDEVTAIEDACRIEHVISDESFNALREYMNDQGFSLDEDLPFTL